MIIVLLLPLQSSLKPITQVIANDHKYNKNIL